MTLIEMIDEKRKSEGLSLIAIGRVLGVSGETYRKWTLSGSPFPLTWDRLRAASEYLETHPIRCLIANAVLPKELVKWRGDEAVVAAPIRSKGNLPGWLSVVLLAARGSRTSGGFGGSAPLAVAA